MDTWFFHVLYVYVIKLKWSKLTIPWILSNCDIIKAYKLSRFKTIILKQIEDHKKDINLFNEFVTIKGFSSQTSQPIYIFPLSYRKNFSNKQFWWFEKHFLKSTFKGGACFHLSRSSSEVGSSDTSFERSCIVSLFMAVYKKFDLAESVLPKINPSILVKERKTVLIRCYKKASRPFKRSNTQLFFPFEFWGVEATSFEGLLVQISHMLTECLVWDGTPCIIR